MNVDDHQANIDRRYPFIEQGSEPPGRFIDAPQTGGRKWSGESGWRTRHGLAIVWWDLGRPFKVELAFYPGTIRGGAGNTLDRGWRRRAADGRRWILGAIAISPDDVAFTDGEQPVYAPPQPAEVPNLEADLARDAEFLNALQDDRFANAVYAVFQNRNFYKGQNQPSWAYGNRETARMIRDLRGLGESYQDWFPHSWLRGVYPDDRPEREASLRKDIDRFSQPLDFDKMVQSITAASQHPEVRKVIEAQRAEFEKRRSQMEEQRIQSLEFAKTYLAALDENADVFKEIHNHLKRLGWRSENAQDRERSSRRRLAEEVSLLEELRALDRRPEANPGEWAEPLRRKDLAGPLRLVARSGTDESLSEAEKEVRNGGVRRKLVQLAITGRISREEYDAFLAKLNKIGS